MEKHQTEFKEAIENTPIIPAIKDAESLEQCLKSDACVIFILFGDICNIAEIVERIKAEGKLAMVHMDLIAGLGSKEVSVDYIKERTRMASLRPNPCWQNMPGSLDLLRYFVFLSLIPWHYPICQSRPEKPDLTVLRCFRESCLRSYARSPVKTKHRLLQAGLSLIKRMYVMHWMPGQLPSHLQMRRYGFCKYGGYWEKYICIR